MKKSVSISILIISIITFLFYTGTDSISKESVFKKMTFYVPAYSSIIFGDRGREIHLAVTLSIRNTDINGSIYLESADYYDTSGKLLKRYNPVRRELRALESVHYAVAESDVAGGVGANFIVVLACNKRKAEPLVEAVMIGATGQQGISFTSRGVTIDRK